MTEYTDCMVDTILMTYEDLLDRTGQGENRMPGEVTDNFLNMIRDNYGVTGLREYARDIGTVIELAWVELNAESPDWCEALLHGGAPLPTTWRGLVCFDWDLVPKCVTHYVYLICVQDRLGTKDFQCTVEQMKDFIKSIPEEG